MQRNLPVASKFSQGEKCTEIWIKKNFSFNIFIKFTLGLILFIIYEGQIRFFLSLTRDVLQFMQNTPGKGLGREA